MGSKDADPNRLESLSSSGSRSPTGPAWSLGSLLSLHPGAVRARVPRQRRPRRGFGADKKTREAGHRIKAHANGVHVAAWAPNRALCIAEATRATVAAFVDTSPARMVSAHRLRVCGYADDRDLLIGVLAEVSWLMDTDRKIPVGIDVTPIDDGVDVLFALTDARALCPTSALPGELSLRQPQLGSDLDGWFSSVSIDTARPAAMSRSWRAWRR